MASEKKGNWFERNWGWLLLAVGVITAGIFGFRAYKRRARTWESADAARFFKGDEVAESHPWYNAVGYRFASKGAVSGIKKGDTVTITPFEADKGHDVKVIEVWNDQRTGRTDKWYVITEPYTGWVTDNTDSGTLKLK